MIRLEQTSLALLLLLTAAPFTQAQPPASTPAETPRIDRIDIVDKGIHQAPVIKKADDSNVLADRTLSAPATIEFDIQSEFGDESAWTRPYLEQAAGVLVSLMENPAVAPPRTIRVNLRKDPNSRGVSGRVHMPALFYKSDVWAKDKYRLWILAHELGNLFAIHYAGTGEFPSDWFHNDRSPFPEYLSCLLMQKLGYLEEAKWRKGVHAGKKDHALYWELDETYGFRLFAQFFQYLRRDRVNLGKIGAPWPHPDKLRSMYTIAYLSLAARTNLAAMIQEHGIGKEPDDWKKRFPQVRFAEYKVAPQEVEQVLTAREKLFGKGVRRQDGRMLQLYRIGRYKEVLAAE